ncbi:O-fucosyltransferase 13 isoform X2 [Rosa chinensis]|uniref:O-fucosyltransferase 13 isoform X2 n=1 Tax=Rosa chinensis TaxID=74649 RepID=UPI001AD90109|nr:O-fucosyltransferase 13 isoform X2 [Rosa chinensis]
MAVISVKPMFTVVVVTLSLILAVLVFSPTSPFYQSPLSLASPQRKLDIWSVGRIVEWRPCKWWLQGHLTALPSKSNGFIRVDCYGGLNQMRRDLCDGVGIARLLNATLVLPKFEVAAYWNESRYPQFAKAALCQACYSALRLTKALEKKASELLEAIPKPFLSLHLRFEPDMVAYSQCEYPYLSPASIEAVKAAQGDRKPWTGELAQIWRKRGKCPLTPNETAFILQVLSIPTNTNIYLAAGDGLMEIEGLTSVYTNVVTKSSLLSGEDFKSMHGNTKAALDYYVSINSDSYIATYFGNMDKMVAAMRAYNGLYKTLFLSRRAFAEYTSQGLIGKELMQALWKTHRDDFVMGRGSALPDCFCEFKL